MLLYRQVPNSIELSPNICRNPELHSKYSMEQKKYLGKEWEYHADPYAKSYSVIEDEDEVGDAYDGEGVAEDSRKHDPLDGVWLSDHDDPPVLDGGMT